MLAFLIAGALTRHNILIETTTKNERLRKLAEELYRWGKLALAQMAH